jgi:hypothetical protein
LAVVARDAVVTAGRETIILATAEEARAMTGAEPEEAAHVARSDYAEASACTSRSRSSNVCSASFRVTTKC